MVSGHPAGSVSCHSAPPPPPSLRDSQVLRPGGSSGDTQAGSLASREGGDQQPLEQAAMPLRREDSKEAPQAGSLEGVDSDLGKRSQDWRWAHGLLEEDPTARTV